MGKRKRRAFTKEFKAEAARLVRESGKSVPSVARELEEREELAQLRRENPTRRMERDILKKRRPSLPRRTREVRVRRGGEGLLPRAHVVPRARRVAGGLPRLAGARAVL